MLVEIDSAYHNEFIIEELDEEHLLVKEAKVEEMKRHLHDVSPGFFPFCVFTVNSRQKLKQHLRDNEDSDSET